MRIVNKVIDDPVTSGILIVNFLLVLVVLSQVAEARKSSERQLRAYLTSTVGGAYRQGASRGLKFEFRPVVVNTGQTPAYNVNSVSSIQLMTLEEALTFDFSLPEAAGQSVMTLGPHQERFTPTIFDRRLSKAELRDFKKGNRRLFVYGTIHYRDTFRKRRHTNYCYVINWWGKRAPPIWHTANRHNDSN